VVVWGMVHGSRLLLLASLWDGLSNRLCDISWNLGFLGDIGLNFEGKVAYTYAFVLGHVDFVHLHY